MNLLSNAIKYNREGGVVTVGWAAVPPNTIDIQVSDTGAGIAAGDFNRLFIPFERLGADRSGIEGSGLGLALSKRLAEAMGGTIWVSSVVGEGSTFVVNIPIWKHSN